MTRNLQKPLKLGLWALAFCLLVLQAPARSETMETVSPEIVTGSRIYTSLEEVPSPTYVITSDDIAQSGARSLVDLLTKIPGITSLQNNGFTQEESVKVRGLVTEVLFLIDGIPYYKASHAAGAAAVDLRAIPLENVDRIEIVKGAGSALYGSMAAGGVINIITKKPRESQATLDAETGNDGWQRYVVNASVTGDVVDVGLWYRHREEGRSPLSITNGVVDYNLNYNEDAGGVTLTKGPWSFASDWGRYVSDWTTSYYNALYPQYSSFNQFNSQENTYSRYSLAYNGTSDHFHVYRQDDKKNVLDSYGVSPYSDEAWGAEYYHTATWKTISLTGGLDFRHEEYWCDSWGSYFNGKRDDTAPFLEISAPLGELLFDVGLRYEMWRTDNAEDQNELTPKFSLSYQDLKGNLWYATAGRFFAMPSLFEISYFGYGTLPSPNLNPEKGWSYEVGVKNLTDENPWSLGLFYTKMEDRIRYDGTSGKPSYINVSDYRAYGIEAFKKWLFSEAWSWQMTASWTHAEEKLSPSSPWGCSNVPVWDVTGTLAFAQKKLGAYLTVRHEGDRKDGLHPDSRADRNITTADLGFAYDCGLGKLHLDIMNLFNTDSIISDYSGTEYYGPERRVIVSLERRF